MIDRDEIAVHLRRIGDEIGAGVLVAREFGSRARNLDGPHSDRDVGFVFVQAPFDYVGVGRYLESVDRDLGENEFVGWNLRRFGDLLSTSNPTTIEFLNSDVEYVPGGGAWDDLREYVDGSFKPIALIGHYRSLAESNYEPYVATGDDATVERNLYAIRALLYAKWVEETGEVPPLDFLAFLDDRAEELAFPDDRTRERVLEAAGTFADAKRRGRGGEEAGNPLGEWIEAELTRECDRRKHDVRGIELERLNAHLEGIFDGAIDRR